MTGAKAGNDVMIVSAFGFNEVTMSVEITQGTIKNLGDIKLTQSDLNDTYYEEQQDMLYDEAVLDDEEGGAQSIIALKGASDDIYYNAANYDFNTLRFRLRGYNSEYQETYMNGLSFNDLARGRFNYSQLGGLNRAFRNKSVAIGLAPASYGFGDIGGATNINTLAADYAPGFNGSVAYTNSNYMFRAMAMYSTGLNRHGWALTAGAIGRYVLSLVRPLPGSAEGVQRPPLAQPDSLWRTDRTRHQLSHISGSL